MGADLDKTSLAMGAVAFQLYLITFAMTSNDYRVTGGDQTKDDAVQAFLIIAYLCFLTGFILLLLMNFTKMDGRIMAFVVMIIMAGGAVCDIIGVGVYADWLNSVTGNSASAAAYSLTGYITAACAAILASIFLLLKICCGGCCKD